jgi:crossover junction endodeoxyribonuclease RusA
VIRLVLPYPVSANRYWATRVIKDRETGKPLAMTYVTPEAKAYREQVGWIARGAGVRTPLAERVAIHLQLYPNRPLDWARRARKDPLTWDDTVECMDLGNAEKVLSDALQGIVYDDDKRIWRQLKERMEPDGQGARVVLTIERCPPVRVQLDLLDTSEPQPLAPQPLKFDMPESEVPF